jgi:glycosyltransferase involved in cell wall biosynthesis
LVSISKPRVLFAYRSDIDTHGGAAIFMREGAAALETLGVEVEVTYETRPANATDYDVAHVFNVWHPATALEQLRYLHSEGVPIVWQPIYLDLREYAFANPAVRAIFAQQRSEGERQKLLRAFTDGTLTVNGMSRWTPNEVMPGFFNTLKEMTTYVDHISAVSLNEIQLLAQHAGLSSTPFTVVPNGVHSEWFGSASPEAFQQQYGVRDFVLCVGAVEPRKNQLMLIEALRGSGTQVVLVGPCFEPDYLAMCCLRGGDDLVYIDRVPRDMVASAFAAASVHVLPSFAEGASLANMEAASAGCPIVVSNRSSEFEYFGDLAFYCNPADPESILRSVAQAAEARGTGETDRCARLVERMREFTWERAAAGYLSTYQRVLERKAAARRQQTTPLSLEGRKSTAFLYRPGWSSDNWKSVLSDYCRTFSEDDDVTLVLLVDPAQGFRQEQVVQAIEAALTQQGISMDDMPDLLLVPDVLDEQTWARAYAAVDWVISDGDTTQAERAMRYGARLIEASQLDRWPDAVPLSPTAGTSDTIEVGDTLVRMR